MNKKRENVENSTEEEIVNNEPQTEQTTADTQDVTEEVVEPCQPSELELAKLAAEEYKRKWYSVSAEYDNYRKRNAAATSQAYADGKAEAILKLLPVADTFGYALDGASDEKTKAGIEKIIKNFNAILSSLGVEQLPLNVGDVFDEGVAEAIMSMPCGEGEQPNTVKQILKQGYKSGDKVIRFAQVIVTAE